MVPPASWPGVPPQLSLAVNIAMHPAQTRTSAGFRILIDSKASASLRCSGRFQANILFSVAYGLFGALAALFQLPVLCFQALADSFVKTGGVGYPHFRKQPPTIYQRARIRYFRTDVPFLTTGTLNWAAKAAVLVNLYVDESISQSPPIGSLTSTVIGVSL